MLVKITPAKAAPMATDALIQCDRCDRAVSFDALLSQCVECGLSVCEDYLAGTEASCRDCHENAPH